MALLTTGGSCCRCFLLLTTSALFLGVDPYPEQGSWEFKNLNSVYNKLGVGKSLYSNSSIRVMISCQPKDVKLTVTYSISRPPCVVGTLGVVDDELLVSSNTAQVLVTKKLENWACPDMANNLFDDYVVANESLYLLQINLDSGVENKFQANVNITMRSQAPGGFLSAIDWPLLPFYGTMCVVYALYALVWLVLCFCYWRDMLRIQLWIGAVIFLGLLEKAVRVAEYESINKTGYSVDGAVIAAEMVSCFKRSLARMLVIIVSLGFGIIKPTLGPTLHRITALGFLYFVLSSAEAIVRTVKHKSDPSTAVLVTIIPQAILDALICWWIFVSLVQTIRTLLLRRNIIKLNLYRHFRNTLIVSILASIIFAIWSFRNHKMTACLSDWKLLWTDDAFYDSLFSLLLLVIMVLWRPSANNQRYSYSPLHDVDDDGIDLDQGANENLGDAKKIRNVRSQGSGLYREKDAAADDDMRWIDENIPTSVLDIAIPDMLDGDEDTMKRHREEVSKMQ